MSSSLITVATCNLNQWALDFDANLERVIQSIEQGRAAAAIAAAAIAAVTAAHQHRAPSD